MKLYIQVQNGEPVGHPATEENLVHAFPGIDLNDPACGFAEFRRVPPPPRGPYHVLEDMVYMQVDGVYVDVYPIRNMTPIERLEHQAKYKNDWANSGVLTTWVFDEKTCAFVPPVPVPDDPSRMWVWDDTSVSWVDVTPEL